MIETVDLAWDLTHERPTIGGALVLRQEGELLARVSGASAITLHLICRESERNAAEKLAKIVFDSSSFPFHLKHEQSSVKEYWPSASVRAEHDFSYFSFTRLLSLYQENGRAPRLSWNLHHLHLARQKRAMVAGKLICVHLRSVAPFSPEESNADGPTWSAFFEKHARPSSLTFLLLGDDPLPADSHLPAGVLRAIDHDIDLATQLALVGCADGFLGMASGLCTAANLSDTPHVIFKHPKHHVPAMARELGSADRFPFAGPRQLLWRREVDATTLEKALIEISP